MFPARITIALFQIIQDRAHGLLVTRNAVAGENRKRAGSLSDTSPPSERQRPRSEEII